MSSSYESIVKQEKRLFAPGVRRWPLALERGEGSRVWDVDGREYLDLTAGWGVTCLGHSHPELAEAIADQARTLMQTTNVVYSRPQLDLAERLARIMPDEIQRVFFVSSGTEANEGALKLAHRATGRSRYVATTQSFHGRTLGALSVLGQEKYRAPWSTIIRENSFVPYGDLDAAKAALGDDAHHLRPAVAQAEHGGAPRGDDEDGGGLAHGGQLPQSLGRRGFGGLNQGRASAAAAHGDDAAAPKLGDGAIHRQQGDGFARGGHGNQFETVRHDGWPMEPQQPCRRTRRPAAGSHPSVISSNTFQPLETAPDGPVPGDSGQYSH